MSLFFNIKNVLQIQNQNASINIIDETDVGNNIAYDMAFVGAANFLSGNYTQNSSDINDIKSTLTVDQSELSTAHFLLVDSAASFPFGGRSAYGNSVTRSGHYYGTSAVTELDTTDAAVNIGLFDGQGDAAYFTFGTDLVPMTKIANGIDATLVDGGVLLNDGSNPGEGLYQAVAAALFKKIGKNAAILNDQSLIDALSGQLSSVLAAEIDEVANNYSESKFFGEYVDSGRYASDTAASDINDSAPVSYNLNDLTMNFVVSITGSVIDSDSNPQDLQAGDATSSSVINRVFGAIDATNGGHLIRSDGTYSVNCFVQLKHDERL